MTTLYPGLKVKRKIGGDVQQFGVSTVTQKKYIKQDHPVYLPVYTKTNSNLIENQIASNNAFENTLETYKNSGYEPVNYGQNYLSYSGIPQKRQPIVNQITKNFSQHVDFNSTPNYQYEDLTKNQIIEPSSDSMSTSISPYNFTHKKDKKDPIPTLKFEGQDYVFREDVELFSELNKALKDSELGELDMPKKGRGKVFKKIIKDLKNKK